MNAKEPFISVVIPTYNHAHFLKRCLDSILNQTYSNWEAVVVNNFSTDNTEEVVGKYKDKRIQLVNFRNNGIIAASRNEGIRRSNGKYIAFLDSDDWWYPKKLEVVCKSFPEADIVYHDLEVYTHKWNFPLWTAKGRALKDDAFIDLLVNGNALLNSSVVVKKQILVTVGGVSEDKALVAGEDWDLWLKIARQTNKFVCLSKSLGAYWGGPENYSKNYQVTITKNEAIKKKYYSFLTPDQQKKLDAYFDYQIGRVLIDIGEIEKAKEKFSKATYSSNAQIRLKAHLFKSPIITKCFRYLTGVESKKILNISQDDTKKKKIVHLITDLNLGGAEMMLVKLLSNMDRSKFDPVVVSLTEKGKLANKIEELGVPLVAINMRSLWSPLSLIIAFVHLVRCLRKIKPDLVQAWLLHANFFGMLGSFFLQNKTPVIWNMRHGSLLKDKTQPLTTRILVKILGWMSQFPELIIYNSHLSLKEHRKIGFTKSRSKVIGNGFETDIFSPSPVEGKKLRIFLGIPENAFVIGMIGRFDPLKDHNNFIKAAENFSQKVDEAHFVLVGKNVNWENKIIVQLIDEAGLRERVHLLGSQEDVSNIYTIFDVFTCSSYSEGFPNVVGEAMASAVPCVVTDAGDSSLIVGDTGIVTPVQDHQALVCGWLQYYRMNSEERRSLGLRARERIKRSFHISTIVQVYENQYFEICNQQDQQSGNIDHAVVKDFGLEWSRFSQSNLDHSEHKAMFEAYFSIFPWDRLNKETVGFDLGCGSGRWAKLVAPKVSWLHCIDPSDEALSVARKNLEQAKNCSFHLAGAHNIPLPDEFADFGYSLGVLHHLPDTQIGVEACVKKLKKGAPFLLYLYYRFDHSPPWFINLWQMSDYARKAISRLPGGVKTYVSDLMALIVYWPLARLAFVCEKCGINVENFPLSYYRQRSLNVLRTDALDRFGTRLEQRFTKKEIQEMMLKSGLKDISFSEDPPYWCAIGYKV